MRRGRNCCPCFINEDKPGQRACVTRPVSSSSRVWLQSVNMLQQQKLLRDASQAGQVLLVDGALVGCPGLTPLFLPRRSVAPAARAVLRALTTLPVDRRKRSGGTRSCCRRGGRRSRSGCGRQPRPGGWQSSASRSGSWRSSASRSGRGSRSGCRPRGERPGGWPTPWGPRCPPVRVVDTGVAMTQGQLPPSLGGLEKKVSLLPIGFLGGSDGKESSCSAGDPGSIPGSGGSPGKGNGYPLQYSGLENPHGQKSLVGCSPWGHRESDMTEKLTLCKTGRLFFSWLQTRQTTQTWCVGCWRFEEYGAESLRTLSSFFLKPDKLSPLVCFFLS